MRDPAAPLRQKRGQLVSEGYQKGTPGVLSNEGIAVGYDKVAPGTFAKRWKAVARLMTLKPSLKSAYTLKTSLAEAASTMKRLMIPGCGMAPSSTMPVERLLTCQANLVDAGASADSPGAGETLCCDVEIAASLAWTLVLNQGWQVRPCAEASSGQIELDQGDLLPRCDHQLVSVCANIHLTLGFNKLESGPASAAAAAAAY
ncbi:MAG: hypothetical protein FRX49_04881 [Trebouxia sp. A1-2]|nr:MAG: hypothetical protein FRX49_04881 [Trebouxia sp. A1-2]